MIRNTNALAVGTLVGALTLGACGLYQPKKKTGSEGTFQELNAKEFQSLDNALDQIATLQEEGRLTQADLDFCEGEVEGLRQALTRVPDGWCKHETVLPCAPSTVEIEDAVGIPACVFVTGSLEPVVLNHVEVTLEATGNLEAVLGQEDSSGVLRPVPAKIGQVSAGKWIVTSSLPRHRVAKKTFLAILRDGKYFDPSRKDYDAHLRAQGLGPETRNSLQKLNGVLDRISARLKTKPSDVSAAQLRSLRQTLAERFKGMVASD